MEWKNLSEEDQTTLKVVGLIESFLAVFFIVIAIVVNIFFKYVDLEYVFGVAIVIMAVPILMNFKDIFRIVTGEEVSFNTSTRMLEVTGKEEDEEMI